MLRDATLLAFCKMLDENEVAYGFHKSENVLILLDPDSRILFRPLDSVERIHLSDALEHNVTREFPMRRKAGERGGPALN
jgi:hypothetical protein